MSEAGPIKSARQIIEIGAYFRRAVQAPARRLLDHASCAVGEYFLLELSAMIDATSVAASTPNNFKPRWDSYKGSSGHAGSSPKI